VGFYYNRARWMNPSVGRFVSVDPLEGDRLSPPSLHRFVYARNSPTSMSDPTGQLTLSEVMVTVTVLGILALNVSCGVEQPIILSKRTTLGPLSLMDGEFYWGIAWNLSRPSRHGGYIIQTVHYTGEASGGILPRDTSIDKTYQEAWEVRPGKRVTTQASTVDDYFGSRLGGYGPGSAGAFEIEGAPVFYEGLALPPDFIRSSVGPAGELPATYTIHTFNVPGSNTVPHHISACWNSRCGSTLTGLEGIQ
jgi:hypothetical protein